jgi:hypothetical protein
MSRDDLYKISTSSDKNFLFGAQYKRDNFFAIFHKASGQKQQQAVAKRGEEGSY